MQLHANAKLGPSGRYALVSTIESGRSLRAAAAAFSVSPATAHRWWHRWCSTESGLAALADRSSSATRPMCHVAADANSGPGRYR
jgi:leucine-zipper of insertion element IS481